MYRAGKKGTTIGQLINLHIESSEEVCAMEFARGQEVVSDDDNGVKDVNPDRLTWILVNAVKELSAEVEQLKSQLNN